jgi:hypothetical protein
MDNTDIAGSEPGPEPGSFAGTAAAVMHFI